MPVKERENKTRAIHLDKNIFHMLFHKDYYDLTNGLPTG